MKRFFVSKLTAFALFVLGTGVMQARTPIRIEKIENVQQLRTSNEAKMDTPNEVKIEIAQAIRYAMEDADIKSTISLVLFNDAFNNMLKANSDEEIDKVLNSLKSDGQQIIIVSLFKKLLNENVMPWNLFVLSVCRTLKNNTDYVDFCNIMKKHIDTKSPFALVDDLSKFSEQVPSLLWSTMEKSGKISIYFSLRSSMKNKSFVCTTVA